MTETPVPPNLVETFKNLSEPLQELTIAMAYFPTVANGGILSEISAVADLDQPVVETGLSNLIRLDIVQRGSLKRNADRQLAFIPDPNGVRYGIGIKTHHQILTDIIKLPLEQIEDKMQSVYGKSWKEKLI